MPKLKYMESQSHSLLSLAAVGGGEGAALGVKGMILILL